MKSLIVTDGRRKILIHEGGEWGEVSGFTSRYEVIGWIVTNFSGRGKKHLIQKTMKDANYEGIKLFFDEVLPDKKVANIIRELAEKSGVDFEKLKLVWHEVVNMYEKVGFLQFELRDNKMAKGVNKLATKVPDNIMVRLDAQTDGKGNRCSD